MHQKTLASFGFTKKVTHRGKEFDGKTPENTEENKHGCSHCDQTFQTVQGLAICVKCKHSVIITDENVEKVSETNEPVGDKDVVLREFPQVRDKIVWEVVKGLINSVVKSIEIQAPKKRRKCSKRFLCSSYSRKMRGFRAKIQY